MHRLGRVFVICTAMLAGLTSEAKVAKAETMVDFIIQHYQQQCDEMQARVRGIDDELDPPADGVLTIGEGSIYEIQLTADGLMGTVVYSDFGCSNFGHPWCGSGGCGFDIVVNDASYVQFSGFRPFSVEEDGRYLVIMPIHGSRCEASNDRRTAGVDPCYAIATWNERHDTFLSVGQQLQVSPLLP